MDLSTVFSLFSTMRIALASSCSYCPYRIANVLRTSLTGARHTKCALSKPFEYASSPVIAFSIISASSGLTTKTGMSFVDSGLYLPSMLQHAWRGIRSMHHSAQFSIRS